MAYNFAISTHIHTSLSLIGMRSAFVMTLMSLLVLLFHAAMAFSSTSFNGQSSLLFSLGGLGQSPPTAPHHL